MTHRKIKSRAAAEGMTLSDFLLREIESLLERPTLNQTLEQIASRGGVVLKASTSESVREERERD